MFRYKTHSQYFLKSGNKNNDKKYRSNGGSKDFTMADIHVWGFKGKHNSNEVNYRHWKEAK